MWGDVESGYGRIMHDKRVQSLHHFTQVLTEEQRERISLAELDPNEDDKLILSISPSGSFSIARYIEANLVASPKVWWDRYVWNHFMTHRANAFMWRVLHNALPVDQNVQ